MTRISVIVPTWNRRRQVTSQTEALLATQTMHDFELVVVDDGSTDGTTAALLDIAERDDRLRVMTQPHTGVSAARNTGASVARGEWLVFLDSDDEPDRTWLAAFDALLWPGVDLASTAQRRRLPDGTTTIRVPRVPGAAFGDVPTLWQAGSFAIARTLFNDVGGYWSGLSFSENTDLALRVARQHELYPVLAVFDTAAHHTVNIRPDRYDPARRLASAQHILEHHRGRLERQPALLATYEAMAGVAAGRLGDRRQAQVHLRRAVRANPIDLRHTARLVRATATR